MTRIRSRKAHWTSLLVALLAATLSSCGEKKDDEAPQATPQNATPTVASTNAEPVKAQTAPTTGDTNNAATDAPPQQVSETDDGSETVDEPTQSKTATPVLKLASVAKPEPKPAPSQFKEGVHYQRLVPTQPTNVSPGQVEVVEVFWYGCPHCFALDPKLEAWRQKGKANYVTFTRVPATWNDTTLFHGRVFYTAEMLGKLEELHTPIFREIHVNGNPLNTMDKVKAFFTAQGVDKGEFDKTFASFALEKKLESAQVLNRRYRVQGVPFFIVNGKFTADVGTAGGEEQLLQLLNELTAREHGG